MKLYISTKMLAVFSLREVELSRRIHCFPTGERERIYSILFPRPPVFRLPLILLLLLLPSPAISRNALFSFLLPTFSRRVSACILYPASRPNRASPRWGRAARARHGELFPFASWDERISAGANMAYSIEQKYARNSLPVSLSLPVLISSPNGPETFLFY